jgi:DNA-binding NarL/FixJ family response regulator
MNMFASLAEPMLDRPGDPIPYVRPAKAPAARKRRIAPANPWGFTYGQCAVLSTLCEVGKDNDAALLLGVTNKAIEAHMAAAKKKMGVTDRVLAILAWDRFTRTEGEAA